jgi:hypothetical protein
MTHDFCRATSFCKLCGAAEGLVWEGYRTECSGAPNVVAISHLIAQRRNARLTAWVREHIVGPEGA